MLSDSKCSYSGRSVRNAASKEEAHRGEILCGTGQKSAEAIVVGTQVKLVRHSKAEEAEQTDRLNRNVRWRRAEHITRRSPVYLDYEPIHGSRNSAAGGENQP